MDSLVEKVNRRKRLKPIIWNNIQKFRELSGCSPISLPNSQQIVAYESRKIYTAYLNNIESHLGNWIRGITNNLLKIKERKATLTKELQANGCSQQQIAEALKKQIFDPAKKFKEAISSKNIDINMFDDATKAVYKSLEPFFKAYPSSYEFKENSIYLDIKINPINHMNAFVKLASIAESHSFKIPACFPLRKSNIPCRITLDNKILRVNVMRANLNNRNVNNENLYYWKQFCNLDCSVFSRQANRSFHGIATTDGVSISIVKQSKKPESHGYVRKKNLNKEKQEEFKYIDDLTQNQILDTQGQCVVIDPGRRDLLFCLQEDSTSTNPVKLRYACRHVIFSVNNSLTYISSIQVHNRRAALSNQVPQVQENQTGHKIDDPKNFDSRKFSFSNRVSKNDHPFYVQRISDNKQPSKASVTKFLQGNDFS